MANETKCANCKHWERIRPKQGEKDHGMGKCFANPPAPGVDKPFPKTYHHERCPKFERK